MNYHQVKDLIEAEESRAFLKEAADARTVTAFLPILTRIQARIVELTNQGAGGDDLASELTLIKGLCIDALGSSAQHPLTRAQMLLSMRKQARNDSAEIDTEEIAEGVAAPVLTTAN